MKLPKISKHLVQLECVVRSSKFKLISLKLKHARTEA